MSRCVFHICSLSGISFRVDRSAAAPNPAYLVRVRNRGAEGYSLWGERHKINAATLVQMPNCPQCGAELGSGDPAGLCPKCLIQGAFDSSVGAGEFRTQTID